MSETPEETKEFDDLANDLARKWIAKNLEGVTDQLRRQVIVYKGSCLLKMMNDRLFLMMMKWELSDKKPGKFWQVGDPGEPPKITNMRIIKRER